MKAHILRRILAAAALSAATLGTSVPTPGTTPPEHVCGLTTLDGTIVADPTHSGRLTCGPGLAITVREDLGAKASANRTSIRDALVSFAAFTDFQLSDEESPLRAEFLDKCDPRNPLRAAFRWQETMLPQLINAEIQTANAIGAGPETKRPFDFAVQLGDAADNQQFNEVRWFMTLLDGSTDPQGKTHLVNPDSGADGYEGVQARDPIASPVTGTSVRDLANEPFYAAGLRSAVTGGPLPWYSVMGNHDMKTQGTMPNTDAWKAFAGAWVTGDLKVTDLAPDEQQRVCDDPTVLTDPAFWQEIALTGHTKPITADPNRRQLSRTQWIAEHLPHADAVKLDPNAVGSYGLPAGHGFADSPNDHRCTDATGALLPRGCYSFDIGGDTSLPTPIPLHFIALDTNDDQGLDDGNIDPAEWDWLQRDLVAHSSRYWDTSGAEHTTANKDALVVVFSHHTESKMTNTTGYPNDKRYSGADLEALFHRFPNVILHANGHTHENKVWAHPDASGHTGGYWEVNTSAIADWPHQSRTIEIADNHDGTLSIIGVNFDAAVAPDPRTIPWTADQTPERSMLPSIATNERESVKGNSNEAWLASAAREVGYSDPQSGHTAPYSQEDASDPGDTPKDKNVELLLRNPFGATDARAVAGPKTPCPNVFQCYGFKPPTYPFRYPFPPGYHYPRVPFTPPSFPGQFPRTFAQTGPGLGAPHNRPYVPVEEPGLLMLALGVAIWLYRARIRTWIVER